MITYLGSLRSSCANGERKILVDLETDNPPDTAQLIVSITGCESGLKEQFDLKTKESTFEHTHQCTGSHIVTVQETSSGLKTEKYLDLDA